MHEVEMLVLTFILEGTRWDAMKIDVDRPGKERSDLSDSDFFLDFSNGALESSSAIDMSAWHKNAKFGVSGDQASLQIPVDDKH